MTNHTKGVCYLLFAIFCFLIFAFDIEYDRNFFTWIWAFNTILSLMGSLRSMILHDIENFSNKQK